MNTQKRNHARARIVLVTCPSLTLARKIARAVVQKRFAACVNVVRSPVESFYAWKGKLESAGEHLLILKTTAPRLSQLEREVKRLHPYDVPEFIALPITEGAEDYLSWLRESAAKSGRKRRAIARPKKRTV
jgi:periplasmic divalent cation tolerance protein